MVNSTIINKYNQSGYTISTYKYKVLKCNLPNSKKMVSGIIYRGFKTFDEINKIESKKIKEKENESKIEKKEINQGDLEPVVNESQDKLIESLLKKADDISNKYLKVQMELESLKQESKQSEDSIKKRSFKEGQESIKKEISQQIKQEQLEIQTQFESSIQKFNNESMQFNIALKSVKEELVAAALEIAKEVIIKELNDDSNNLVLTLATSLMEKIESKSTITLKIHPSQTEIFNKTFKDNDNIKIVSDAAINSGGIIIISQMGTIETDIMQRFEHIKQNTLCN